MASQLYGSRQAQKRCTNNNVKTTQSYIHGTLKDITQTCYELELQDYNITQKLPIVLNLFQEIKYIFVVSLICWHVYSTVNWSLLLYVSVEVMKCGRHKLVHLT